MDQVTGMECGSSQIYTIGTAAFPQRWAWLRTLRRACLTILLLAGFCAFGSSASFATVSCADTTGGSSSSQINVTYYLTGAGSCSKTAPSAGTPFLSANVVEGSGNPHINFNVAVASVVSAGGCGLGIDAVSGNTANFKYRNSGSCTTTIVLSDGVSMAFADTRDGNGVATSYTAIVLTIPSTATTVIASPGPSGFGQAVTFRSAVYGGGNQPAGATTFYDGTTNLGSATLGSGAGAGVVGAISSNATATFVCALTSTSSVECWGSNASGQLGDGTTTQRLTPVGVSGLSNGVIAVASGGLHACALTLAGGVKCWGSNASGQLGDGTTTSRSTPADVTNLTSGVIAIGAGGSHTCALTSSGGVKCWGLNASGQLGDSTTTTRLAPVDVNGLTSGVSILAVGTSRTCVVTTSNGAECWGDNSNGGIGDGTTTTRLTPATVLLSNGGVRTIAVGNSHTCALITNGGAYCWGFNNVGQLGDGSQNRSLLPISVQGLSSDVAAIAPADTHTCALLSTGDTKCWGDGRNGQLGQGAQAISLTPIDVSGLTSGVSAVATSEYGGCALPSAGTAQCWGRNTNGQNGDGTTTERDAPVAVSGLASPGFATAAFSTSSLALGSHTIQAVYLGGSDRSASLSNTITQQVVQALTTTAVTVNPASSASTGQPITITAQVTSNGATPTGNVEFFRNTTRLGISSLDGNGVATFTTSTSPIGNFNLSATFDGSTNFTGSASPSVAYSVVAAPSTVTISASPASSTSFGQTVSFTVFVTTTGDVTGANLSLGYEGGNTIGTTTLATGQGGYVFKTSALPAGNHTISASFAGTQTAMGATSAVLPFTVLAPVKQASTTTLTATPNPSTLGQPVTITATVTGAGATGSVNFMDGATVVSTKTLSGNSASATVLPPVNGNHALTAVYSGDGTFNGSTSSTVNLTVHVPCTDAFGSAADLPGASGTVFGTTVGATGEPGEPDGGVAGPLNSVWCKWTAPAAGSVTFDTTGSIFDTTLAVYTGSALNALTLVAANNNISNSNAQSRVSFVATAGTTYMVQLDGAGQSTGSYTLNWTQTAAGASTFASVLPSARSVTTGSAATAFATIINAGTTPATGCSVAVPPGFPALFSYQTTAPNNLPNGTPNTPATIAPNGAQSFVFAITPLQDQNGIDVGLVFGCANTPVTTTVTGLNTLLLSASSVASPDLISVGATPTNDGILNIPGNTGTTAFAASTINIGAAGSITASIDDNGKGLLLTPTLCVSDATGTCTNPPAPAASATFQLAANGIATFSIFVTGTGTVPFDPGNNRLFLRFKTPDGVTRGATSVAVRTQ